MGLGLSVRNSKKYWVNSTGIKISSQIGAMGDAVPPGWQEGIFRGAGTDTTFGIRVALATRPRLKGNPI